MYDPALKPYPYDPEEAKRLLAEAGYPNGFEITMKLWTQPGRAAGPIIGEAVAMMWQKIGVKVKLEPTTYESFRSLLAGGHKNLSMAWVSGGPFIEEPVASYMTAGHSKGITPTYGFATVELDKLIEKTASEPNNEQRAKLYRQMGQYVYDNYLMVPIAIKNTIWGVSNRVGDWALTKGMARATNWESITHGPGFKP